MKTKNLYTQQVENLKRRLGQKWVSRWTENPKGRSRQKLGIKAYDYVPSSRHLPTRRRFVNRQSSSTSTGIFSHLRNRGNNELPKQSNCSILQGTKVGSAGEHNQEHSLWLIFLLIQWIKALSLWKVVCCRYFCYSNGW